MYPEGHPIQRGMFHPYQGLAAGWRRVTGYTWPRHQIVTLAGSGTTGAIGAAARLTLPHPVRDQRGGTSRSGHRLVVLCDTAGSIGWSVQPASARSSARRISAAEA
jgi:hypothetical protein